MPRTAVVGSSARVATAAVALAVFCAWAVAFGPQILGGPAQYVIVSGHSMDDTLHDGDLVIARRQSTYDVGDIVAYRVPKGDLGEGTMVIHRIVGGTGSDGYLAQGDNNPGQDPWHPRDRDVVGKLFVHVPRVGLLLTFLQTTLGLALLAGLASAVWAAGSAPKPRRAADSAETPAAPPVRDVPEPPSALDERTPAIA